MNANELADGILAIEERIFLTKKEHQLFQNSAKMLRQQQTEIEALKKELALQRLSDIGQEIEQEPVAWVSVLGIDHIGQKFTDVRVSLTKTDVADIPLYTHPTQLKKASEK